MLALLAALSLAAAPAADFDLQLPPGFHPDAQLAAEESAALAPLASEVDVDRRLVAFYRDDAPEPATLALSTVDAPLALDASSKSLLASAVSVHFKRQLDLPFALDRSTFIADPVPRLEVWGTVSIEGKSREVAVAFYGGQHRHVVAVASVPSGRVERERAELEGFFASVTPREPPSPFAHRRTAISLAVWGLAALALLVARVVRRRRARPAAPTTPAR